MSYTSDAIIFSSCFTQWATVGYTSMLVSVSLLVFPTLKLINAARGFFSNYIDYAIFNYTHLL